MNKFVFSKSKSNEIKIILNENGKTINDNKTICETFNQYFISCIQTIIPQNLPNPASSLPPPPNIQVPFQFDETNPTEIEKIILNLKQNAAVGHDNISTKFCTFIKVPLSLSICTLINNCIAVGDYPDCLKTARIVPIFKGGDKLSKTNYRPIAVISVLAKIFEKVIYTRIEKYITTNNIINKNQFGFCSLSNTLAAATQLITTIKTNLDDKMFTSCLFIDLQKAFDSVNHDRLLMKLQNIGITGNTLRILTSYLKNRDQFVKVGNSTSSKLINEHGVPQGSILGPPLFNIFCNDIFCLNLKGQLIMYADDMAITYKSDSLTNLYSDMQHDVNVINEWMTDNLLKINETKSKFIIFEQKNKTYNTNTCTLTINGTALEKVSFYKYLGLIVDSKLDWSFHIQKIKDKIRKTNFILYQMKDVLPTKVKILVFHSHVLSSIRYLLPVYDTATQTRLKEIQVLMNKCLKTIFNLPYLTPSAQLYNKKFLRLDLLIKFELLLLVFKIKNNLIKNNFFFRSINSIHTHRTRQANNLYVDFCRTTGGQHNPIYKGLQIFNNLPAEAKEEKRISVFKEKIVEYLIALNR